MEEVRRIGGGGFRDPAAPCMELRRWIPTDEEEMGGFERFRDDERQWSMSVKEK